MGRGGTLNHNPPGGGKGVAGNRKSERIPNARGKSGTEEHESVKRLYGRGQGSTLY